jgi:hypothetical protein
LFQPTGDVLQPKGQTSLLHDLPQHRLAPGPETHLQAIVPCHEIIHLRPRSECLSDRQEVRDDARPLVAIGIVESALVSIDAIA